MELNFTVTNQRIKYVSNLYIVEKSKNYLTAKFSFSGSEWKNVAKTAIFKKDDNVINVLLDENGRCDVPWELITRGTLKVSVFGGDLVTVDTAEVKILKSGYEEGNAPSEPTSDVYAQILAELQSIRDDFITEEMLGQAVEDWLAENVVEALSPADVEKIVYDYLDEHKDELKGEKGAVFTPHVSDEGVMSWTNDGGLENPPPVDLKINAGSDYALLTEAGYSLNLSVDKNYVLTIDLLNKAGTVLSSKNVDLPLETMFINATYANGVITLTLQNGNTLDVDISDIVIGIVPTSRKIAGVDLEDDITAEELKTALGVFDSTVTAGELKPWLYIEEETLVSTYNGKPLYRKVLKPIEVTADMQKNSIEDIPYEYITIDQSVSFTMRGGATFPITNLGLHTDTGADSVTVGTVVHHAYITTDKMITFRKGSSVVSYTAYITLQYTKTTDAEGSGNNLNPYGIYDAKLDEGKADIEELQRNVSDLQSAKDITTTDSTTLSNSNSGRVKFNKIVGGIEQAATSGKNLLDCSGLTESTVNGVTFTPVYSTTEEHVKAGYPLGSLMYINVNGTPTDNADFLFAEYDYESDIVFNGCPSNGSLTTYRVTGDIYEDDTYTESVFDIGNGASISTSKGNRVRLYILIFSGQTISNAKFYPMVRLATETDATYEPYTNGASPNPSYPQPIYGSEISEIRTHGKNFLNIDSVRFGYIDESGNHCSSAGDMISDYIKRCENMYLTLNTKITSLGIAYYDKNKNYIGRYNTFSVSFMKINNIENCEYIRLWFNIDGEMMSKERLASIEPMLNEGTTALPYEPYTESSITLSNPITLYGDELVEDVERKYYKLTLSGSNIASVNYYETTNTTRFVIGLGGMPSVANGAVISNIANRVTSGSNANTCRMYSATQLFLFLDADTFPDKESLLSYMENNEIIFVYELADPTTEELPTEDQIALNSLPTYDGITYVEFIDAGVQPSVSIDYGTSKVGGMTLEGLLAGINGELQSQLNNDRITALESAVVNNV